MSEHDHTTDTLQDLIHLANEPLKLFIHLLYQVNDVEGEITNIALIADALEEVCWTKPLRGDNAPQFFLIDVKL